jgi:hypothetical protein
LSESLFWISIALIDRSGGLNRSTFLGGSSQAAPPSIFATEFSLSEVIALKS